MTAKYETIDDKISPLLESHEMRQGRRVTYEESTKKPPAYTQFRSAGTRTLRSGTLLATLAEDTESDGAAAVRPTYAKPKSSRESRERRWGLVCCRVFVALFLFSAVLVCSVVSKVTLVELASGLNLSDQSEKAGLYWMLLFVLITPHCVTFLRCLVYGVCGKKNSTHPWPRWPKAFIWSFVVSVFEVSAMTTVVFVVLPYLHPLVALAILSGVFVVQTIVDTWTVPWTPLSKHHRDNKDDTHDNWSPQQRRKKRWATVKKVICALLENKLTKTIALMLQLATIITLAALYGAHKVGNTKQLQLAIAIPLSLLALSFVWCNKTLMKVIESKQVVGDKGQHMETERGVARTSSVVIPSARFKAYLISSFTKIVLYFFVPYVIVKFGLKSEPWCLNDENCVLGEAFSKAWHHYKWYFLLQIPSSFLAYFFVWISCAMRLHKVGLVLPLALCTPVSVVCCVILHSIKKDNFNYENSTAALAIVGALWLSEVLSVGLYLWNRDNLILSKDKMMFMVPEYNGVFLEQHIMLNRQRPKKVLLSHSHPTLYYDLVPRQRTIFICSTMYHENDIEMRQMLTSVYRVACRCYEDKQQRGEKRYDKFESHIFFDGSINGTQLTHFALQLVSLLEDTVHADLRRCMKQETPYGYRLSWNIGPDEVMPFSIHMKDNLKVKNKKRWSQVMYMNYVLNYRIRKDQQLDDSNTFILTTDADIDFSAESAVVLIDNLASNPDVGAVCARTHPKGNGPVYWYQVFDYAIGHWLQKSAEHVLGCVLCSPGCFSLFRCSALRPCLETYSTEVTDAFEFLTKDMGEDRWLCTLLVKNGWRLEYCAVSEDLTYCPDDFDEFFRQRRRWVPSTIANLMLLISEAWNITKNNDTVSILFVLYQFLNVFSTAISPATVILVMVAGMQTVLDYSSSWSTALICILILISVAYGLVCIYTSQKTQLDVAKLLTLFLMIVMCIAFSGIAKGVIDDVLGFSTVSNETGTPHFRLPFSPTSFYMMFFVLVFIVTALLHLPEVFCLVHGIWYLLGLPSGYLILLIYSAANLDNRSWGTREGNTAGGGSGSGKKSIKNFLKMVWEKLSVCCLVCCLRDKHYSLIKPKKQESESTPQTSVATGTATDEQPSQAKSSSSTDSEQTYTACVPDMKMDADTDKWLKDLGCEHYTDNFEQNGYINFHFIAEMKSEDFDAIGVEKRGFRKRIEKAAKKLPSLPIKAGIPENVYKWLEQLELEGYADLFRGEGYDARSDIENLKGLSKEDLKGIGITKRAHLQRLGVALKRLQYPTAVEVQVEETKGVIENTAILSLERDEADFWERKIKESLEPVSVNLTQIDELKVKLRTLRNAALVVLLIINIMWIVLLYSLTFDQLEKYKVPTKAFELLFLVVYLVIISLQFLAMVMHRAFTFTHYLARVDTIQEIYQESSELGETVVIAEVDN